MRDRQKTAFIAILMAILVALGFMVAAMSPDAEAWGCGKGIKCPTTTVTTTSVPDTTLPPSTTTVSTTSVPVTTSTTTSTSTTTTTVPTDIGPPTSIVREPKLAG